MAVEYRPASEAQRIADDVIAEYHPHLIEARVEYVFRSEAKKSGGRIILGQARKVTGLNAWLATERDERAIQPAPFFLIELAEDTWADLTADQRVALVDHELSHCWCEYDDDGELKLSIRGHDLEEFTDIVRRHGLWKDDLDRFVRVGAQSLSDRGGVSV